MEIKSKTAHNNEHSRSMTGALPKDLIEAEEAKLLSAATSQAMIAARSILLSGGSQATAMSTARAAAHSVLVNTSKLEGSALSKVFMNKRKAKQQAEIVASMALLSVKQETKHYSEGMYQKTYNGIMMSEGTSTRNDSWHQGVTQGNTFGDSALALASSIMTGPFAHYDSRRQIENYNANTDVDNRKKDELYSPQSINQVQPESLVSPPKRLLSFRSSPPSPQTHLATNITPEKDSRDIQIAMSTQKLPGSLPKSKNQISNDKHRESAKNVAKGNPTHSSRKYATPTITSIDDSSLSESDSGTFDTGTYDSSTLGSETMATTIATTTSRHDDDKGGLFMSSVDPFLSTWKSLFFCGEPTLTTQQLDKSSPRRSDSSNRDMPTPTQEYRQDADDGSSYTDSEEDVDREIMYKQRLVQFNQGNSASDGQTQGSPKNCDKLANNDGRGHASHSTMDSEQLLRELNLSSADDETSPVGQSHKNQNMAFLQNGYIRESMEQAVLRALKGTMPLTAPSPSQAMATTHSHMMPPHVLEDELLMTYGKSKDANATSASSTLNPSNKNRMTTMAQRIQFRNWMRQRRADRDPIADPNI